MYILSKHAKERMEQRGISEATVAKAAKLVRKGKTQHVAIYFNATNEYIAFDTADMTVISTMHMTPERIRMHKTGLRAAQAHGRHNHTYVQGV